MSFYTVSHGKFHDGGYSDILYGINSIDMIIIIIIIKEMLLVHKPEGLYALYKTAKKYREQKHEYHTLQTYSTVLISTKINYDMG